MTFSESGKKGIAVILNGISGRKKYFYRNILPSLSKLCNAEVFETRSEYDALNLASNATDKKFDLIIAAGGDGTLNQVVNGVLFGREAHDKLPVIGVLPIGSGNDFARTAAVKATIGQLESLLTRFQPKRIDIGKISYTLFSNGGKIMDRYFVNVADIGMGPVVVNEVLKSPKALGAGFAYYLSILSAFISYKPVVVKAITKDWQWEGKLRTLGIANGKCYGHGLYIAPDAVLNDRQFNAFICGDVSVLDFIRFTSKLKKGKYIRIPEIHYKETTSIELTSEQPCMIEGDGEILGLLPAKVELIAQQLEFLI